MIVLNMVLGRLALHRGLSAALLLALWLSPAQAQSPAPAPAPAPPAPAAQPSPYPPGYAYPPGYPPPYPYPPPYYYPPPAPAPAPAAPEAAPPKAPRREAEPARIGFQMAFRTGVMIPFGQADANDRLAHRYSTQFPIVLDLGAKLARSLYLGGYLGLSLGAEGSDERIEEICDDDDDDGNNDISCTSTTVRIGVEAQYQFAPDARLNPWLGYGIGYEMAVQTIDDGPRGYSESTTASGMTWAKLDSGFIYRTGIGIGPYVEFSAGRFTHTETEVSGTTTFEGDVSDPAWHAWFTLGMRLVVLP